MRTIDTAIVKQVPNISKGGVETPYTIQSFNDHFAKKFAADSEYDRMLKTGQHFRAATCIFCKIWRITSD